MSPYFCEPVAGAGALHRLHDPSRVTSWCPEPRLGGKGLSLLGTVPVTLDSLLARLGPGSGDPGTVSGKGNRSG